MKLNSASAYKRPVCGLSQVSVYSKFQNLRDPWMEKTDSRQAEDGAIAINSSDILPSF